MDHVVFSALLLLGIVGNGAVHRATNDGVTVIRNVTLVDVLYNRLQPHRDVIIVGSHCRYPG